MQSRTLRDFKGRGSRAVASERSEDTTRGPRPLKSRGVRDSISSMFRFVYAGDIQTDTRCCVLHSEVRIPAMPC